MSATTGGGEFDQYGGSHTITGDLILGKKSGSEGYYYLYDTDPDGNPTTPILAVGGSTIVGKSGYGEFDQYGGSHTITGDLILGKKSSGEGYYYLSGDPSTSTLTVGGSTIVGNYGYGEFDQDGGTHTVTGDLILGNQATGNGTYNLQGGTLDVSGNITGGAGASTINIDGGTLTNNWQSINVGNFNVGYAVGSNGAFTLDSKSLTALNEQIGGSGTGMFNQSGGMHTVGGNLVLGDQVSGSGTYNLSQPNWWSPAILNVNGSTIIGNNGTGLFNQSGGIHTVGTATGGGTLTISANPGTSSGTYNLNGGTLTVYAGTAGTGGIVNNDTFNFSGGTLNSNLDNFATMAVYGDGTKIINGDVTNESGGLITVSNAKITFGSLFNYGQLTTDPAALVFKGDFIVGSFGVINAAAGDQYQLYKNLEIDSDAAFNNTLGVELKFRGGVSHDLSIGDGTEWRKLTLETGNTISLPDGVNLTAGGLSGLNIDAGTVTNIHGTGTILYDPLLNPTLSGTYNLDGGGSLQPLGSHMIIPNQAVWTGPTGEMWNSGGNWDIGNVPPSGYTALVYGDGSKNSVIVNYNGSYDSSGPLGSLQVDYGAKIKQSDNTLTVGNTQIGIDGIGSYVQSGGTHSVIRNGIYDPEPSIGTGILALGVNPTGKGIYVLSGTGSLNVETAEYVGYSGTGIFKQSGGTNTITGGYQVTVPGWGYEYVGLDIGSQPGRSGKYTLTGGLLDVWNKTVVGNQGTGIFNLGIEDPNNPGTYLGDGTHKTDGLYIGYNGGNGQYNLYSGNLNVGWLTVIGGKNYTPNPGTGEFNQYGGTVVTGLYLGDSAGSIGTYNLSGGSLDVYQWNTIGGGGTGIFNQTGGIFTLHDGNLEVGGAGGGNGTYNLISGNLLIVGPANGSTVVGDENTGIFNQSGGTHEISNNLYVGNNATGTYNLYDGQLIVNGSTIVGNWGTGTFNQYGGTHTVTGALTIQVNPGSSGIYNMSGGKLDVKGGITNNGTFNFTGGDVFGDLANYGKFFGSAIFTGNVTNYGIVSPGSSPGMLTISGNYTQDVLGTLLIELGGNIQGTNYDFLKITGTATLAGLLDVDLYGGFIPHAGDKFNFLVASGGLNGTMFDNYELPYGISYWNEIYGTDMVSLEYLGGGQPVPVPSTLLLLGTGLIGLAGLMRRKLKR